MPYYTNDELEGVAQLAGFPNDKGRSLGPFVLGFFADAICFGLVTQLFTRWQTYAAPSERWLIKGLVYYLMALSTITTVFILAWIMHLFVYGFGTYAGFIDARWASWFDICEVLARTPVSIFFAHRAWRMMGRPILLAGTLFLLIGVSLAFALASKATAVDYTKATLSKIFIYTWLSTEVTADLICTGCIAYGLMRSRTGWKSTDKVVTKLLVLVAETQLPPTIVSATFLILYIVDPTVVAFFVVSPKVYVIVLFIVLNTRYSLRRELDSDSDTRWKDNTFALRSRSGPPAEGTINIATETYVHNEANSAQGKKTNRKPSKNDDSDASDKEDGQGNTVALDLGYTTSQVGLTRDAA